MFDKEIKFISHKKYVDLKDNLPVPIKLDLPKWFKELKHDVDHFTVKGCIPFLDSLTSGYLLKIQTNIYLIILLNILVWKKVFMHHKSQIY